MLYEPTEEKGNRKKKLTTADMAWHDESRGRVPCHDEWRDNESRQRVACHDQSRGRANQR